MDKIKRMGTNTSPKATLGAILVLGFFLFGDAFINEMEQPVGRKASATADGSRSFPDSKGWQQHRKGAGMAVAKRRRTLQQPPTSRTQERTIIPPPPAGYQRQSATTRSPGRPPPPSPNPYAAIVRRPCSIYNRCKRPVRPTCDAYNRCRRSANFN